MAEKNHHSKPSESQQRNSFSYEQVYSPYVFSPFQQPLFQQEEMIQSFTPLMSPVSTPTVSFHQLSLRNTDSPALQPLEEFGFLAPSAMMEQSQQNPQYTEQFAPMTPSQLMQMNREGILGNQLPRSSSRNSSRGSSGNLKPLLPVTPTMRPDDAELLAQKSNYQTVMEGYGESYGIGNGRPVQVKKISHKEAEQKRRDNLKNHFKIVKQVLPPSRNKNPSKVLILKKGNVF
jgi:hypothetical protein